MIDIPFGAYTDETDEIDDIGSRPNSHNKC